MERNRIKRTNVFLLLISFLLFFAFPSFADESPATVDTLSPNSGSSHGGEKIIFSATFSDSDGWQDIQYARILVNTSTIDSGGVSAIYYPSTDRFQLFNDTGIGYVNGSNGEQGCLVGTNSVLANTFAILNCIDSSVIKQGNSLTVRWSMTFKGTFVGAKNIYLNVTSGTVGCIGCHGSGGYASSGWIQMGNWVILNDPPVIMLNWSITERKVMQGVSKTFHAQASDPNGDLLRYQFWLNNVLQQDFSLSSDWIFTPGTDVNERCQLRVVVMDSSDQQAEDSTDIFIYRKPKIPSTTP